MIKTVPVHELCEQLESDEQTVLIDLRTPREFAIAHVPQARNIPRGSMPVSQLLAEWSRDADGKSIYFICQSGAASERFVEELVQEGYFCAQCVAGGMLAWQSAGLPLAIECEVKPDDSNGKRGKLLSGLAVMLGCVLGFLVHRGFFAVPILMAAENIFSGITGWSGIASLFGRKNSAG